MEGVSTIAVIGVLVVLVLVVLAARRVAENRRRERERRRSEAAGHPQVAEAHVANAKEKHHDGASELAAEQKSIAERRAKAAEERERRRAEG
jgi:hypothetical protein